MQLHRGVCGHRKRVCTESWLWEKNPLLHQKIKLASVAYWPNTLPTELHPFFFFYFFSSHFLHFQGDFHLHIGSPLSLCGQNMPVVNRWTAAYYLLLLGISQVRTGNSKLLLGFFCLFVCFSFFQPSPLMILYMYLLHTNWFQAAKRNWRCFEEVRAFETSSSFICLFTLMPSSCDYLWVGPSCCLS